MNLSESFLTFLVAGLLSAGSAVAAPTVSRHDLRLVLHPAEAALEGSDTLQVDARGASHLRLQLAPQVQIDAVSTGSRTLPFDWRGGTLTITLPDSHRRGATAVTVRYHGRFADPVPENPVTAEDPSYGVAAVISTRGTFLSGGAGWYPAASETSALFRVRIEAPTGYEAVTGGRLLERGSASGRTFSLWETNRPLPDLTLSAGPYRVRETRAGSIPVYTYFYPETTELAETYLAACRRFLDLYAGLFGPYPYEKFAVVENFFPTGYGFPSWTLLGSSVVRLPFIVETSLGHEIAHSWWGTGVRVAAGGGNWSEGLTTYVADHLYKEKESPEAAMEYRLKILRDYASLVTPEKEYPLSGFSSRRSAADQAIGYGKGAMLFHQVRRQIGDEAFWRGLRQLGEAKMGKEASWDDFSEAFGRSAGADLRPLFRQWVERRGAPMLELDEVTSTAESGSWRVRGSLVQSAEPYALRVTLRLEHEGGAAESVLSVAGRRTTFDLSSPARPLRLVVDPQVDLFRRLVPEEIPPTVNAVRGSTALTVIVADRLPPGVEEQIPLLLAALRQEGATIRPEAEVRPEDLSGRDLLCVGWPRRSGLLPPLPRALGAEPSVFSIDGERRSEAGAALFTALPHPSNPLRTAALFLPLSGDAAELAARKLPHYGKYSYLVFVDGSNRQKGIWPPGRSPLVHEFLPYPR